MVLHFDRPPILSAILIALLCLMSAVGLKHAVAAEESFTLPQEFLDDSEAAPQMEDMQYVVLQGLDKITARTSTFDVKIGDTVKFGSIFIKPRSCKKNPPFEAPESTAFLQIWENRDGEPTWVFSNWMFASSPALSAMDHPVYDIWVLDCRNEETNASSEEKRDGDDLVSPSSEDVPETE